MMGHINENEHLFNN